jgi:hypothetical protein
MPFAPLRISTQSEEDLRSLSEEPLDNIEAAYTFVASIPGHVISPKPLRDAIKAKLSPNATRALIRQLIAVRSYIDHAHVAPSEAVEALTLGLKSKNWPNDLYPKWENFGKVLERFLSLENIITTAKALELALDFEHILTSSKIITDIRPVYSATRDKIIGGIVCNRLRLRFHDEDNDKSISLSLDKDDIERLQGLCGEALKKIEMASDMLKVAGLPSFITGEGYDDLG